MLTRRRLLATLSIVAAGGVGGGAAVGWYLRRERDRREAAVLGLAEFLPPGAGAVGTRYLAGLAPPPTRTELVDRVLDALESVADERLDPAERAAVAIRADFAAGRTVVVDGWVLAATEARLFALRALANAEGAPGSS